jgi:xyloglucan-specific endo-beta-1,4-glucanase
MLFTSVVALAAFAASSIAAPTPTEKLAPRASSCGQWDSVQTGAYTVYNNLWGQASANAGGKQCFEITSASGNSISWSTSWNWSGGQGQVKSYTDVGLTMTKKQLSAISKIPSTWSWSYSGSNIVADVAYDLFLNPSASSTTNEYEIMIWLGALGGAGPISSTGSPIATTTIGGQSFQLYYGLNGSMKVYSFVASSKSIQNFSGDLKAFFTYLNTSQKLPLDRYLASIQAGTEPFSGSNAKLTTSSYSVSVS